MSTVETSSVPAFASLSGAGAVRPDERVTTCGEMPRVAAPGRDGIVVTVEV